MVTELRPQDTLAVGMAADGRVRAAAAVATQVVREAAQRHGCSPVAAAALGRTLIAALLLSTTLKGGARLTLRIFGNGPLGAIVADTDGEGHVRGYVSHPWVQVPLSPAGKLDVGRAVGREGVVHVSRDMGLRQPYHGQVPLVSGEIAEDVAHYLVRSEQVPSAVSLGVFVDGRGTVTAAGGLLVQLLPGGEDLAEELQAAMQKLPPITELLRRHRLTTAPALLQHALAPWSPRVLDEQPVSFSCPCSRDRAAGLLLSLGEKELAHMAEEDHGAELTCHFCGAQYRFSEEEIRALLQEARAGGHP